MCDYIILLLLFLKCSLAQLIINLPEGVVKGGELKTAHNQTYHGFQGIPYASPPLGNLRFRAPVVPQKWKGVLDGTQYKSKCRQARKDLDFVTEDCLHLSVFTPVLKNKTKAKLPVIFYIFGGGFSHGNATYDGQPDFLIEKGVVFVSHNYRVGPFGFLSTGDNVIPGNAGLKDQQMALKWTYQNIHLFGGDPYKITLLGVSAGAASVGYHILSKKSAGLFRAGIAQSGSPLNIWASMADPKSYTYDLANKIEDRNVSNFNSQKIAKYLRAAPAEQIDAAAWKTALPTALPVLEQPSAEAFITESMYEQLKFGNFNKVPLLIGTVSEEEVNQAINLSSLIPKFDLVKKQPSRLIPVDLVVKENFTKDQVGEEIYKLYFENVPEDETLGHLIRYLSQNQFSRALIKHAELQSNFTSVYFYQFSYVGPMGYSCRTSIKGADQISHGGESYYIYGMKHFFNNEHFSKFPDSDILTQNRMIEMWSNFAKYLNPTPQRIDLLQNITWPVARPGKLLYLNIDRNLTVLETPKKMYYLEWNNIFEKYAVQPFVTY